MQPPRQVQPGHDITSWSNLKYAHGVELLYVVRSSVATWSALGHVYGELKLSDDGLSGEGSVVVLAEPPYELLALTLGDALHNFRSALDTLAWELCHLDGGTPANPSKVYFPITDGEKAWKDRAQYLATMPPEILERIRLVQPFLQPDPVRDLLATLGRLSNFDKHRARLESKANVESLVLGVNMDLAKYPSPKPPTLTLVAPDATLQDGQTILTVSFENPVELRNPSGRSGLELQYIVIDNKGSVEMMSLLSGLEAGIRTVLDFVLFGGKEKPLGEIMVSANFPAN